MISLQRMSLLIQMQDITHLKRLLWHCMTRLTLSWL